MNNELLTDIQQMSDSREILAEHPHGFLAWFIYLLIALLASAFIWASLSEIDYYVLAYGEVRTTDKASMIRNTMVGRIVTSNLEEGRRVKAGDILLIVDADTQRNKLELLEKQYYDFSNEILCLQMLKESIISEVNMFDPNDVLQLDYYNKYEKYVADIAVSVEQINNTNNEHKKLILDAKISKSSSENLLALANRELFALQLLIDSISCNDNLIPAEYIEQYTQYENFQIMITMYESDINQKSAAVSRTQALFDVGGVSAFEYDNAKHDLESAEYEMVKYNNEFIIAVSQRISALKRSINEYTATIQSADAVLTLNMQGYSAELVSEKNRLDALTTLSDTIFNLKSSKDSLEQELGILRATVEEAVIVSPIDGVISILADINEGDYIQSILDVAVVLPTPTNSISTPSSDYKARIAVSNADIASIKIGQMVKCRFAALPYNEYGELSGSVISISTDAHSDGSNGSYYFVELAISETVLKNEQGIENKIKVGMAIEARVITKSRKIIYWVLDKLDFII